MNDKIIEDGFYWIIIKEEGDEPEVAELICGEWYVTGSSKAFHPDIYDVSVLSNKLVLD